MARFAIRLVMLFVGLLLLDSCGGGGQYGCGGSTATPPVFSTSNITITSYSPKVATTIGGITVTGTNFLNVQFAPKVLGKVVGAGFVRIVNGGPSGAGTPAAFYSLAPLTDTSATVLVPSGLLTGPYDLYLISSAGVNNGPVLNTLVGAVIIGHPPTVYAVSPVSGPPSGGNTITLYGVGFTGTTEVDFWSLTNLNDVGKGTNVVVKSDGIMTLTVPPEPPGAYYFQISATFGGAFSLVLYTYIGSPPKVKSVTPSSGPLAGGNQVSIAGSGFTGATYVSFAPVGGQPPTQTSDFEVNSDSSITVVAPAGTAGQVNVLVQVGTVSSAVVPADTYSYVSGLLPTVTSVSPNSGSDEGGNSVEITGTGFTGANDVYFGSIGQFVAPATNVVVVNDTEITATVPALGRIPIEAVPPITLNVYVQTPAGRSAAVSADSYTYTSASGPMVTSVSPSSFVEPYTVPITVTGSGFTGVTAVNFVEIGGSVPVPALSFHFVSDSQVTCTPPSALNGTYDVVVTTPSGNSPRTVADQVSVQY